MGRDDKLYFASTSAGGNTIFRHQPRNLAVAAPNIAYDAYTNAYNTTSNHITYFARLAPATGDVLAGQILLTRLSTSKGNTIEPRAIAADEMGSVYLGGFAAFAIANRDSLSINGLPIANYTGGDAWLMIATPDLKSRKLWTSFTNGGKGTTFGIAVKGAIAAVAVKASAYPMTIVDALQPLAPVSATSSGYFSVLPK
jgi:hypothetical protein